MSTLPASTERLQEYYTAQLTDTNCVQLVDLCRNGWPKHKHQVPENVRPYWPVQGELSLEGDLLLRGRRIVVPKACKRRPCRRSTVDIRESPSVHCEPLPLWPGLKQQLEELIHNCPGCSKAVQAPQQTLISTPLPQHPWEKVASDLFEMGGKTYLLVVDYFSRYVEVQTLTSTTSPSVIRALKAIFSRHSIPDYLCCLY